MLKIERRIIELVERHLYLLCVLLLSCLALYLRRTAVWWNYSSVASYFDMHENYTQTPVYFLVVRLVQYLPFLPLHSIKYIAAMSDFGVAVFIVHLLGRDADARKKLIFFTVFLFSPVLFLRGIIWAQPDSLGILLLLFGYALQGGEQKNGRVSVFLAFLAVIGAISLCPCLLLIVLFYLWHKKETQQAFWMRAAAIIAGGLSVQMISALLLGENWTNGLYSITRFLTYHPESGMRYQDAAEWLLQMIYLYCPAAAVITALAAARHRISYGWTIGIQIVASALYGSVLFTELP